MTKTPPLKLSAAQQAQFRAWLTDYAAEVSGFSGTTARNFGHSVAAQVMRQLTLHSSTPTKD